MNVLHAWVDELFATFLQPCSTLVVVQKVHRLAPRTDILFNNIARD